MDLILGLIFIANLLLALAIRRVNQQPDEITQRRNFERAIKRVNR